VAMKIRLAGKMVWKLAMWFARNLGMDILFHGT